MVSRKELKYKKNIKSVVEAKVHDGSYNNRVNGSNEIVQLHDDGVYLSEDSNNGLKYFTYDGFNQYLKDKVGDENLHITDYFIPNTTEVKDLGNRHIEFTVQVSSIIEPVMYREEVSLGSTRYYKKVKGVRPQHVIAKIVFNMDGFRYVSSEFYCDGELLPILTKKAERVSGVLNLGVSYTELVDWYTKLRTINLTGDEDIKEMLERHGRIIGEG